MAPWKLFSVTDTVKYKAFTCSWSILIISLVYVGLIAVPFLILFRIGNVWPTDSDYEQPSLQFTRLFSVSMKTSRTGKEVITYSSVNTTEQFRPFNFRIPTITHQEFDDNGDGLNDRMDFEMKMPLLSNESIHEVDLILIYNVTLDRSKKVFESLVRIHSSQKLSKIMTLKVIGDTKLTQLKPLENPNSVINYLENRRKARKSKCSDLLMPNTDSYDIISCYVDPQQALLELSDVKHSWQPIKLESEAFLLRALIGYKAKQNVIYDTYHWLAIKWLYIQFAAILLILACLTQFFLSCLFLNHLVDAFTDDKEVKKKQS